jgi:putative flippase GtrA
MVRQKVQRESWRAVGRHWLKFNTVGAMGIGVQLTMLTTLVSGFRFNYLIATLLAVESAVLHNFVWHECWTWGDRTRASPTGVLMRLIQFNLTTGALSILGNLAFMRLFVGQIHLHYFYANLLTIAACSLLNFLINDQVVFREKKTMIWRRVREPSGSQHQ